MLNTREKTKLDIEYKKLPDKAEWKHVLSIAFHS